MWLEQSYFYLEGKHKIFWEKIPYWLYDPDNSKTDFSATTRIFTILTLIRWMAIVGWIIPEYDYKKFSRLVGSCHHVVSEFEVDKNKDYFPCRKVLLFDKIYV